MKIEIVALFPAEQIDDCSNSSVLAQLVTAVLH